MSGHYQAGVFEAEMDSAAKADAAATADVDKSTGRSLQSPAKVGPQHAAAVMQS